MLISKHVPASAGRVTTIVEFSYADLIAIKTQALIDNTLRELAVRHHHQAIAQGHGSDPEFSVGTLPYPHTDDEFISAPVEVFGLVGSGSMAIMRFRGDQETVIYTVTSINCADPRP